MRPLGGKEAKYPEAARRHGINGAVLLQLVVNEEGRVWTVDSVRGLRLFIPAAMDAVCHWEYDPVLVRGEPVPVIRMVTVRFGPEMDRESSRPTIKEMVELVRPVDSKPTGDFSDLEAKQGMIPAFVWRYLEFHYPDLEPYGPGSDIQGDIDRHHGQRCAPNFITGDFDGDGENDHALLLSQAGEFREVVLLALLRRPEGFRGRVLDRLPYSPDFSLCLVGKGEEDFDYNAELEVTYQNQAISWVGGEKAATCYEYRNGAFRRFVCSD